MLNTFVDDNQGMAYPFFGSGALPFPMAVITGIGVCINAGDTDTPYTSEALYVSDVVITEKTVQLSVCRHISGGNGTELVGVFYANTNGYYVYVPSSQLNDEVFEDQTIEPKMLRFVYATAPDMSEEDLTQMTRDLQVFYSYVKENSYDTPGTLHSCGYIQLGTIPPEAVGSYKGEFYLDPSCVSYMPDAVFGKHKTYRVNSSLYVAPQCFTIATRGVLDISVTAGTAAFSVSEEAKDLQFTDLGFETRDIVSFIQGYTVAASEMHPYPVLHLTGQTIADAGVIDFAFVSGPAVGDNSSDAVVIEITGTSIFPNCDEV